MQRHAALRARVRAQDLAHFIQQRERQIELYQPNVRAAAPTACTGTHVTAQRHHSTAIGTMVRGHKTRRVQAPGWPECR